MTQSIIQPMPPAIASHLAKVRAANERAHKRAIEKYGEKARIALELAKDLLKRWPCTCDWETGAVQGDLRTVIEFVVSLEKLIEPDNSKS